MPDEGAEGSAFSPHFIGGMRRSWVSVRAFAVGEGTLRGDVGRTLRSFSRAVLATVGGGASWRDRDEPICEKALSPWEDTANVDLSFRNRVAKCRARLDELRRSGGEEVCFVT